MGPIAHTRGWSGSRLWEPKKFWGARGPWPWLESYVRAQKAAVWIERQSFQKSLTDPARAPCSEPSRQSTCGARSDTHGDGTPYPSRCIRTCSAAMP